MRISDWSSDVCSSDLRTILADLGLCRPQGNDGGMAGASRSGSLLRDPAISRLALPWPLAGRCRGGDLLYAPAGWFSASMATETALDLDRQGGRRSDACRVGQARACEGGRAKGGASLAEFVDQMGKGVV